MTKTMKKIDVLKHLTNAKGQTLHPLKWRKGLEVILKNYVLYLSRNCISFTPSLYTK